jgi:hypothetical protein
MDVTTTPKTEAGWFDLLMFGNCVERQSPDGTWEHIPIEQWLDAQPDTDRDAKALAAQIRSTRGDAP